MLKTVLFTVAAVGVAVLMSGCTRGSASHAVDRKVLYYVDPMHPGYRSSQPGIAPDCGMQLVAVYAEEPSAEPASTGGASAQIDAATRQLYGIQLVKVERGAGSVAVKVYGRVAADESRIYKIDLGTDGYVKETHNDAVGDRVSKGQHLALIYSPEFLSVAGGYLSANERTPGPATRDTVAQVQNAAGAQARADRLRNLGMSDAQIEEMTEERKIPEDVYVVSPVDGFIVSRGLSKGARFEKHEELYRIADLSQVWIIADVYGQDAAAFRAGASARISLPDIGKTYAATVSGSLASVDATTHALQPRLEVANPGYRLRPGMFVTVEVSAPANETLTVPASAVLDSGEARSVFVEARRNTFEMREVITGRTHGERVEILKGLTPEDTVVASGTFLVDSEARLRRASGNPSAN